MRSRLVLTAALAAGSLWAATTADAVRPGGGLNPTLRPAVGNVTTHFVVSFTAQLTGFGFPDSSAYQLVVAGGAKSCRSAQQVTVPATTPGQRVHLMLIPAAPSNVWCRGGYTARLQEQFTPVCSPRMLCPLIARFRAVPGIRQRPSAIVVRTLRTFRFRVR